MYTRGPVVYLLLVLSLIANFAVVGLFIYSVANSSNRIDKLTLRTSVLAAEQDGIQQSRKQAIHDTCVVMRALVETRSGTQSFPLVVHEHGRTMKATATVQGAKTNAEQFVKKTGLSNCNTFTQTHTRLPKHGN